MMDRVKSVLGDMELVYLTPSESDNEMQMLYVNIQEVHLQIHYNTVNQFLHFRGKVFSCIPEQKRSLALAFLNERNNDLILKYYLDKKGDACVEWFVDMEFATVSDDGLSTALTSVIKAAKELMEPMMRVRFS